MKILCVTLIFLTFSQVVAQPTTGIIKGVISTDSSGSPIVGATIALEQTSHRAHTNKDGAYQLTGIPPGRYVLSISAPGYRGWRYQNLTVLESLRLNFSIKLKSDEGSPQVISTMRLAPIAPPPALSEDRMLFYQPDSTIAFKLRIVNPEKPLDSSATRRK